MRSATERTIVYVIGLIVVDHPETLGARNQAFEPFLCAFVRIAVAAGATTIATAAARRACLALCFALTLTLTLTLTLALTLALTLPLTLALNLNLNLMSGVCGS